MKTEKMLLMYDIERIEFLIEDSRDNLSDKNYFELKNRLDHLKNELAIIL